MKRHSIYIAYLAASLSSASVSAAPQWVTLDADFHRQADKASLDRQGPWAQFTQTWGDTVNGKPRPGAIVERMAVNCLTGAYGQTQYPSTDAQTGKQIIKHQTLSEIEHAETFDARLVLSDNSTPLGSALVQFACTCAVGATASVAATQLEPSQSEMQSTYDRYIAEPLSKVEYHLKFLRVKSKQIAEQAIAELTAGKPFETVFDEYTSPADARTFPHGDLGTHEETEFPIDDVRRYRALEVGEFTRTPHEGTYGWEIEALQSKRTIPAPSFTSMQPRLHAYLTRAHACGWPP